VKSGTTGQVGVVQLESSTASTSITKAATPNSVKAAYDLAADALPQTGGTMTGVIMFDATQTIPVSGIQDATTAQKGLVQIGTNIDVTSGTISVKSASTTDAGISLLNDTTSSTSTTQALTANQGKVLQDQVDALVISNNLTLAGTLDASSGLVVTVTPEGVLAGFAAGSTLPAASVTTSEYFVIVTVASASYTPPGGVASPANSGDWYLASTTAWSRLALGIVAVTSVTGSSPIVSSGGTTPNITVNAATSAAQGVIEIATQAEAIAGTSATLASTPSTSVPKTTADMTGFVVLPSSASAPGTTSYLHYNTTSNHIEYYNGSASKTALEREGDSMSGALGIVDGSAAAPSVFFTASGTDSGFYSPAVDTIGIATAGVSRFHIGPTGFIGVNNTSPTCALDVSGTIKDSIGNVRSIPPNSQTAAYVLALTDNGKYISSTTGGITVPSGVFSAGDVVGFYNDSAISQTVTPDAGVTLRLGGTSTTGLRTVDGYGLITILCVGSNIFLLTGIGLT
jgi:hypothetical protein